MSARGDGGQAGADGGEDARRGRVAREGQELRVEAPVDDGGEGVDDDCECREPEPGRAPDVAIMGYEEEVGECHGKYPV